MDSHQQLLSSNLWCCRCYSDCYYGTGTITTPPLLLCLLPYICVSSSWTVCSAAAAGVGAVFTDHLASSSLTASLEDAARCSLFASLRRRQTQRRWTEFLFFKHIYMKSLGMKKTWRARVSEGVWAALSLERWCI